jgi:hypothetical protein
LNLAQNHITGDIPLLIGQGRNSLTNIREFVRLLTTGDVSIPHKALFKDVKQKFTTFSKKHSAYNKLLDDLLWIHKREASWNLLSLNQILDAYLQAEEKHLLTKLFQIISGMDNDRILNELLNSASERPALMAAT